MKKLLDSWPTQQELDNWHATLPGKHLLIPMQQQLDQLLSQAFGYYAVCLGEIPSDISIRNCRINKYFQATPHLAPHSSCVIDPLTLPFDTTSVDLFLLPQGFDFVADPLPMLNEISRCLIGEGRILLLGYNASSLFGVWRWLQGDQDNFPWKANFHGFSRIKTLLLENHFEIESAQSFYFRPPFSIQNALEKLKFIEVLGPLLWPAHGAMYAILAKKQISCITPVKLLPKLFKKSASLATAQRTQV